MIPSKCIRCCFNEENWFIPMKAVDSEQAVATDTFSWSGCKNENYYQIGLSKNSLAF